METPAGTPRGRGSDAGPHSGGLARAPASGRDSVEGWARRLTLGSCSPLERLLDTASGTQRGRGCQVRLSKACGGGLSRGRSREQKKKVPCNRERETVQSEQSNVSGGTRGADQAFMAWNLGGMQRERLPEILQALPLLGLKQVDVVAFQEVNMDPGIHYGKAGRGDAEWVLVAGKEEGEWRGRATAVRKRLGIIRHRQTAPNGFGISISTAAGKVGVLNVHLPPKFTLNETGKEVEEWKNMFAAKESSFAVLGDFNETLVRASETEARGLTHRTARGERGPPYPMV